MLVAEKEKERGRDRGKRGRDRIQKNMIKDLKGSTACYSGREERNGVCSISVNNCSQMGLDLTDVKTLLLLVYHPLMDVN